MGESEYTHGGPRTTALDWARVGVGLLARGVFWGCVWFIVGNAIDEAISDGAWLLAIVEIGAFPATFFLYPLVTPDAAQAWPLADGTSFLPFLLTALIAYPISTFIGGLDPEDR